MDLQKFQLSRALAFYRAPLKNHIWVSELVRNNRSKTQMYNPTHALLCHSVSVPQYTDTVPLILTTSCQFSISLSPAPDREDLTRFTYNHTA